VIPARTTNRISHITSSSIAIIHTVNEQYLFISLQLAGKAVIFLTSDDMRIFIIIIIILFAQKAVIQLINYT